MSAASQPPRSGATAEGAFDRAAAFAAGPSRIPRNFVYWLLAAVAALGLGGVALERLVSAVGLNPTPAAVTTPPTTSRPAGAASAFEHSTPVPGRLASFMGLETLTPGTAGPISLVDERGQTVSLAAERHKAVVLSFFDGRCNDIGPVLGAEIREADADLGAAAGRVVFLTVNTDPAATAVSGLDEAVARTGLGHLPNWYMLTGPLSELNTVWRAYAVTVTFDTVTRTVSHIDVMYFLDGRGRFAYSATPFADESRPAGSYVLPRSEVARFALGVATYAARIGGRP